MSNTLDDSSALPLPSTPVVVPAIEPSARVLTRRYLWLVAALVLLGIAVLTGWFDMRNNLRALRTDVAQRVGDLDAAEKTTRSTLREAQDSLRDAQAKLALLENRLAESQTQQAALEALYRELAPSRDEWAITEVEQTLLLASQQLQFAGNVQAALAAMQLADAKLQRLDRPQFLPLRRALGRDMDRLKAVPFVDVAGISLRLDQAIASVDALPLALEERPAPTPPLGSAAQDPAWRRLLHDMWNDIRQLIRIENLDRPELPLLSPPERFFLRENIKLRLLSARFELLFHDQVNFRGDLAAAHDWLNKYFDTRARPVQVLDATLKELQATEMGAEAPDLGRSLEAVRLLKLAHDKPSSR
jgi:uroporphyrin-3 C-methyltransferase